MLLDQFSRFKHVVGSDENFPLTRPGTKVCGFISIPRTTMNPGLRFLVAEWERLPGFWHRCPIRPGMVGLLAAAINENRFLLQATITELTMMVVKSFALPNEISKEYTCLNLLVFARRTRLSVWKQLEWFSKPFLLGALGSTWCYLIDGMRNTGGKVMAGYPSVNRIDFGRLSHRMTSVQRWLSAHTSKEKFYGSIFFSQNT
ncbi:hypothetical protein HPP92_028151 [Vanilla planifolia]|uniref:Uncharacterized protein n=1 Tax=Vanilla planifolia TaxID=51239 RepID=A0A835PC32_VANPL|nr:hypothetical protein HPP92_028151 [Vanilla planifolia]